MLAPKMKANAEKPLQAFPSTRPFVLALCFLAGATIALAQPGPYTTLRNSNLLVTASLLVTNGIVGLTSSPPRLMVSGVAATSAQGGRVALVNTQLWAQRFHGPVSSYDQALGIVVDSAGNVCVSGNSVDSQNYYDIATLKYGSDGTPVWTNRYPGSTNFSDSVRSIAVDAADNIYVAGESAGSSPANDIITIKYSASGTALWTNRYNRSGTNYHQAVGLAVDSAGSALVLVETFFAVTDYTTVKYDTLGNAVWTNHYKSSPNSDDYPAAISVDKSNNVFVTGASFISGIGTLVATIKYAGDGTPLWTNLYAQTLIDQPAAMTVDRDGSVIVTGDSLGAQHRYFTVRYDHNGSALWTNTMAAPTYQGGNVPRVVADLSGNVFVTGGSPNADGTNADFTTVKVSGAGVPLWTNRFFDNNTGNPAPGGTAVDNADNFYFAGHATGTGGSQTDWVTIKFNALGVSIWTNRYVGLGSWSGWPQGLAVDDAGDVYVTGGSGGTQGSDYATVKYADQVLYTPPTNFIGSDTFTFTATDNLGNIATSRVTVVVSPASLQFNSSPAALRQTSSGFALEVDGAHGTNPVVIYASTNSVNWQPIYSNAPVLGSVQFLDSASSNYFRRFYRASQTQ